MDFNRSLSLDQLENKTSDDPAKAPTPLIGRCLMLRGQPVGELTAADLRVLIGQNIGTKYLLLLAFEKLNEHLMLEAEYYPGDLLKVVLEADPAFWKAHPDLQWQVESAVQHELEQLQDATRLLTELLGPFQSLRGF